MAKDAKQDLDRKNREYLAKKHAKREVVAATKAGKKAKRSAQSKTPPSSDPVDDTVQEPATPRHAEPDLATSSEQPAGSPVSKDKPPSLVELKRQVKARWPKVRGLADAKRTELVALLAEGDQEVFAHYLQEWAKRAKGRRERWLQGDSKSAQAIREQASKS